ncbi:uncharacterized protein PAC_08634 [Phialocephala subalpina]|uniref:Oligopeptide transporter n=1 Tax=Phialocephala subalpina TaxID=576137 RepID=A0A1L7X152_9HELO|nr:uncharacterized protein PAC_08634 [Phialocephala subalpina]
MSSNGGAIGISSASQEVEKSTVDIIKNDSKNTSNDPSIHKEKGEVAVMTSDQDNLLSHEEQFPEDLEGEVETQQFTVRAVLVGCLLGGVILASNVYPGLKTGWTFGTSLFGSIFRYAILKPLSKALPTHFGGGYFGPKENVCYLRKGEAETIHTKNEDPLSVPRDLQLTILKQKLVFPSEVAAAHTIRSLHVGKNAEANAHKKTRALIIAFGGAITLRCVSECAPGILWDWHWGWTLYRLGWTGIIQVENWNWVAEFTWPAACFTSSTRCNYQKQAFDSRITLDMSDRTLVSIFMSVGMYVLFSAACPCINDLSLADHCSFPAPDVGAWRVIAVAVTEPTLSIPPSSGYTSIALGIFAILVTVAKYRFVPADKHIYVPNMNAIGIAFILNTTTYPTAMTFGSTMVFLWKRNYPAAYAMYCYAISTGFIAGEGLGGIVGAVLQVAKVSGNIYGTAVGCPAFEYCG